MLLPPIPPPTKHCSPAGGVKYAHRQALLAIGVTGTGILTSVQGDTGGSTERTRHPLVKGGFGATRVKLVKWLLWGAADLGPPIHPPSWETRRFRLITGGGPWYGKVCSRGSSAAPAETRDGFWCPLPPKLPHLACLAYPVCGGQALCGESVARARLQLPQCRTGGTRKTTAPARQRAEVRLLQEGCRVTSRPR